jgi:hypothetical protein
MVSLTAAKTKRMFSVSITNNSSINQSVDDDQSVKSAFLAVFYADEEINN